MEPSYLPTYSRAEIERIAAIKLQEAFPEPLSIPVDIDLVAEKQPVIDSVYLLPKLKKDFNVVATITCKPTKKYDIILDADTNSANRPRANFSVAHEVGHIVLHESLYLSCHSIQESIELSKRIRERYKRIEKDANYFAGAILIPRKTIFEDVEKVYEGILKFNKVSYGWGWIPLLSRLCSALANHYKVTAKVMSIRLKQLKIDQHISLAVSDKLDFIPWD